MLKFKLGCYSWSRPIRNPWSRLDHPPFRSRPPDRDPMASILGYRFGLGFLLKSPRPFTDSTRSQGAFKNICSWAQLLADNPLIFHRIEPAVHT